MKYNKQPQGFTLIEILVSLSLLGIVFLLLFSSLYTANKSWIAGEKKISNNDESRLVALFLRRQISQALPITWVNNGKSKLLFKGNENILSFTSTLPAHRAGGGLNLITIEVEQTEDESNLYIKYQPVASGSYSDNGEYKNNNALLISNVENIEFSYFGSNEKNQTAEWHSEWIDENVMPNLIRVKINSSAPGISWPQIDIPVFVDFIKGQPQFTVNSEEEAPLS
jgi:general secretion pathway protein J